MSCLSLLKNQNKYDISVHSIESKILDAFFVLFVCVFQYMRKVFIGMRLLMDVPMNEQEEPMCRNWLEKDYLLENEIIEINFDVHFHSIQTIFFHGILSATE